MYVTFKLTHTYKIVHDAYAMHALLNILLNCGSTIDVGTELNHFKQFTHDFSPMVIYFSIDILHVTNYINIYIVERLNVN